MNISSLVLAVGVLTAMFALVSSMVGVWTLIKLGKQIAIVVMKLENTVDGRLDDMMKTANELAAALATDKERKRGEEVAATLAASQADRRL